MKPVISGEATPQAMADEEYKNSRVVNFDGVRRHLEH
jgi:hypothetical protein